MVVDITQRRTLAQFDGEYLGADGTSNDRTARQTFLESGFGKGHCICNPMRLMHCGLDNAIFGIMI